MRMSRKSGAFFMWRSPGLKTSSIFFTPPSGQTVTPSSGYSVLPGFWERSRVSFSRSGGGGFFGGGGGGGGDGPLFPRGRRKETRELFSLLRIFNRKHRLRDAGDYTLVVVSCHS